MFFGVRCGGSEAPCDTVISYEMQAVLKKCLPIKALHAARMLYGFWIFM